MAKITLVVFALALVLSIQFVACQDAAIDKGGEIDEAEEEAFFYVLIGFVFSDLVRENLLADIKILDNPTGRDLMKQAWIGAQQQAQKLANPDGSLNEADAKTIFNNELFKLMDGLAKAQILTGDLIQKRLFPVGLSQISPLVNKSFEEAKRQLNTGATFASQGNAQQPANTQQANPQQAANTQQANAVKDL